MDVETILDIARTKMLEEMADKIVLQLSHDLTLKDLNFVLKLLGSKEITEYPPEPPTGSCCPWRRRLH